MDVGAWPTIFQGLAAFGAVVAALVAWRALTYFKSQTKAMESANSVTRTAMEAQEKRWEDDRREERRRQHEAVRPDVRVQEGGGSLGPQAAGLTVTFTGGKAIRHMSVGAASLSGGAAVACDPDHVDRMEPGQTHVFNVASTGLTSGQRLDVHVSYRDSLGSAVTWSEQVIAEFDPTGHFHVRLDPGSLPVVTDDLG